jgi:hypothetical protein
MQEDHTAIERSAGKVVAALSVFLVAAIGGGCATSSGYCRNRINDAMDVFTCSLGTGVGAKIQVGPLQTGLFTNIERAGLRGGVVDKWRSRDPARFLSEEDTFVIRGACFFPDNTTVIARKKRFLSAGIGPLTVPFRMRSPHNTNSPKKGPPSPLYTQVEVAIALGVSLRGGVNVGEILDFIVGLVGVDIYSDDIEGGTVGTGSEYHEPTTEQ